MGSLKSFMVLEDLRTSHAERYLTYVDRYHEHVFHDIKKNLEDSWETAVERVIKKYPIHTEAIQDATLKNPKATTSVTLSRKAEKLITSRSPTPIEVVPSVKIPLVYSREERNLVTKELLSAAAHSFEETTSRWKEIFNYEKNGRIKPWFKIVDDDEEVRFQLAMSDGDAESYRTLYAIRTEYGRKSSKIRDFDRLYLVNLIK